MFTKNSSRFVLNTTIVEALRCGCMIKNISGSFITWCETICDFDKNIVTITFRFNWNVSGLWLGRKIWSEGENTCRVQNEPGKPGILLVQENYQKNLLLWINHQTNDFLSKLNDLKNALDTFYVLSNEVHAQVRFYKGLLTIDVLVVSMFVLCTWNHSVFLTCHCLGILSDTFVNGEIIEGEVDLLSHPSLYHPWWVLGSAECGWRYVTGEIPLCVI